MTAYFNRFTLNLTKAQALSGSHQGACDEDIAQLLTVPVIRRQLDKIPAAALRAELKETGAWNEDELQDAEANNARIVWLAAVNIREELPRSNRK